jgi:hypothetical protein
VIIFDPDTAKRMKLKERKKKSIKRKRKRKRKQRVSEGSNMYSFNKKKAVARI